MSLVIEKMAAHTASSARLQNAYNQNRLFCLVDTSVDDMLASRILTMSPDHYLNLLSGDEAIYQEAHAPYLVRPDRGLLRTIEEQFGEQSWGFMFIVNEAGGDLQKLKRHWKRWLYISTHEYGETLLRFWDIRITTKLFEKLEALMLQDFFHGIDSLNFTNSNYPKSYQLFEKYKSTDMKPAARVVLGQKFLADFANDSMDDYVEQLRSDLVKVGLFDQADLSVARLRQTVEDAQSKGLVSAAHIYRYVFACCIPDGGFSNPRSKLMTILADDQQTADYKSKLIERYIKNFLSIRMAA